MIHFADFVTKTTVYLLLPLAERSKFYVNATIDLTSNFRKVASSSCRPSVSKHTSPGDNYNFAWLPMPGYLR